MSAFDMTRDFVGPQDGSTVLRNTELEADGACSLGIDLFEVLFPYGVHRDGSVAFLAKVAGDLAQLWVKAKYEGLGYRPRLLDVDGLRAMHVARLEQEACEVLNAVQRMNLWSDVQRRAVSVFDDYLACWWDAAAWRAEGLDPEEAGGMARAAAEQLVEAVVSEAVYYFEPVDELPRAEKAVAYARLRRVFADVEPTPYVWDVLAADEGA